MDFNKDFLLLQINDALFPIGGYSHSFGLETYIQKNIVTNVEKAKEYILSRINNSIKYTELLGIRLAYNEAEKENIEIKTYRNKNYDKCYCFIIQLNFQPKINKLF